MLRVLLLRSSARRVKPTKRDGQRSAQAEKPGRFFRALSDRGAGRVLLPRGAATEGLHRRTMQAAVLA